MEGRTPEGSEKTKMHQYKHGDMNQDGAGSGSDSTTFMLKWGFLGALGAFRKIVNSH